MSQKKAAPPQSSGEKVPIWIISFADMITLLLSFFVMLQTMAKTRDSTLFGVSQDSFRRAIAGYGVPDILFGKQTGPQFDYKKLKYPTEQTDDPGMPHRVIDADDDQIRHLFDQITRQIETQTSEQGQTVVNMVSAPLKLSGGPSSLDPSDREFLISFASNLKQTLSGQDNSVEIIALAGGAGSGKDQYRQALQKAQAVGEFLGKQLGSQADNWPVTMKATIKNEKLSRTSSTRNDSGILIAVKGAKSSHGR